MSVLKLMLSSAFLLFSFSAFGGVYGIVDIQRVILTVEEGKTARNELESEIKAKQADFLKQKKELEKLNEDWKNQSALLSEQARRDKQMEFQNKFMNLNMEEKKFEQSLKRREAEATQKIAVKVASMVNKMAKDRKLKVVFEANSSGLIYVEDPVDLTADVIKNYDLEAKKVSKK